MRILIATVTAGGGHLAAASALEEAWRGSRPNDVVERLDILKYSKLEKKVIADGYVKMVANAPELLGLFFDKTDKPKVAQRLNYWNRLFPSQSRIRFTRYLKEFQPDAVLCTHFMPFDTLAELRKKEIMSPFTACVVTDFEAHALWMDPCVDLYCVAAEETKARLIARGAQAENIVATGIPVGAKFLTKIDTKAIRKAQGFRDDLPILLVLSGGFGMGPVASILGELDKVERPFQIVVVTGRNEELRRDLAVMDFKHPARVIGFTTNMHEWMALADLIITKPGGLTSSEALALGRPMFILNPIPGQESANSDFLLERGAAAKVTRVEDLPYRIEQLLGSKKLTEMAKAAKSLGRPKAALDICHEVLKRIQAGKFALKHE